MHDPMQPDFLLEAKDLLKRFGGVIAANRVCFAVRPGELRCVIGPNGAGKSTFFSLLCGIQMPDAGRILFKGIDVSALPAFRRVRMGIGLTFQTNRTFHALSVRDNLETARRVAAGSEQDTQHLRFALQSFGLEQVMDVVARELPHHQQQWLEICMALSRGPQLLLLDEPTAGLSPGETRETARVLRALAEDGLAVVVVEHDMQFVRDVASSVTVLHQGAIFAEGTLDDITQREDVQKIYLGRTKGTQ